MSKLPARIAEKFKADTSGCWVWCAAVSGKGYGRVAMNGKNCRAHRVVYELLVGPIPEGLTCDHLCRNRLCVNPAHIELVDNKANILRGVSISAVNAKKTHCKRGHPLTGDNLSPYQLHGRRCKTCARINEAAYVARSKA